MGEILVRYRTGDRIRRLGDRGDALRRIEEFDNRRGQVYGDVYRSGGGVTPDVMGLDTDTPIPLTKTYQDF